MFLPATLGLFAGLLLAAPYLLPALMLRGEVHSELLHSPAFDPTRWSPWRLRVEDRTAATVFATIAIGWSALAVGAPKGEAVWRWATLCAAACSLALVPLVWSLPVLHEVQFPWRLLAVVEFAAVTAFALRPPPRAVAALGGVLLIAAAVPVLRGVFDQRAQAPTHLTSRMTDAVEYLPVALQAPGLSTGSRVDLSRFAGPLVTGPVRAVRAAPKGRVEIDVAAPGRVTLRRSRFAGWKVLGPAGEVPLRAGPLVAFDAQAGHYAVVRAITAPERLGWAGWTLGLLLLAFSLILPLRTLASARLRASLPHLFERPI